MPGLPLAQLRASGGVSLGSSSSGTTGTTVTAAAFGPGATVAPQSSGHPLDPRQPFGLAFWVGVGCIAVLALIRHSLPR